MAEEAADVFDAEAGLVEAQAAKTWRREWKVEAQRSLSSVRGQSMDRTAGPRCCGRSWSVGRSRRVLRGR